VTREHLDDPDVEEPYPDDDPERGIFWGPPDGETGEPRRWSRVWWDWRDDPRYKRELA
jgi:hypothetical protein